jgi:hypothetical protein
MKYELPSIELIVIEENNYLKFGEYLNDMQCDDTANKLRLDDLEYVKKLQQKNEKLKDNWNKLKEDLINDINYWHEQEKEWIKLGFIKFGGEANTKIIFKKVLDKMQEIEGSRE